MINQLLQSNLAIALGTLVTILGPVGALSARADTVNIHGDSDLSSQILTGTSGGTVARDSCGITKSKPDHTINIQDRFNFLRIAAQTDVSTSTLWIVSTDNNTGLCAYGEDQENFGVVELSGLWMPGTYDVYVGETSNNVNQSFCLTLSDDYSGNDFSSCP